MLKKSQGRYWFECDDCGELLDTGSDKFDDAINHMREEQWTPYRNKGNGELEHQCPKCKEKDDDNLSHNSE